MVKVKRTTVVLPEKVKKELKHIAADQDISFTMVITTAVFHFLDDYKAGKIDDGFFDQVKLKLKEMRRMGE